MDLAATREHIAGALSALEKSIDGLVNALAHSDIDVQLEEADSTNSMRRVCAAYSTIDYEMDEDVRQSIVCLGALGVDADILRRAQHVNSLKSNLKNICAPLHGIQVRVPVKGESGPTRKISVVRAILRNIQRSDLNLLAAYRKLPLLQTAPSSITYTRTMTRSVYRKNVEEIFVLLNALDSPTASSDRARLGSLNPRETHLALVKDHYQNVRANILYHRLDNRGRGRVQIPAELPIMYSLSRRLELPPVQFPVDDGRSKTLKRDRQTKLEQVPFLQSLPVYRYLY